MTWESDQDLVSVFDDRRTNSPAYRCPERGTVRLLVDGRVVHAGDESRLSWAKRHWAQVTPREPTVEDFWMARSMSFARRLRIITDASLGRRTVL